MASKYTVNEAAGTVLDTETGLTWQREVSADVYTWAAAKSYAARMDLDGGGWRLPTVEELFGLVDRTRINPAIDTVAFPNTPIEYFWTVTPWVAGGSAWFVSFDDGFSVFAAPSSALSGAVCAVRRWRRRRLTI